MIFLCWGSFLNVVAYRIINGHHLASRSFCPHCKSTLVWYDLIPVLSWFMLNQKCRSCRAPISYLYPLIELLTAVVLTALVIYINPAYWFAYALFFSALMILIRTDLETMLISRYTTLFLIPLALLFSLLNKLPITVYQSLFGAFFGYAIIWSINKLVYLFKKKEGMGEGDAELLATIGAFSGIFDAVLALMIASFLGSLYGFYLLLRGKPIKNTKIPFGPSLAIGALVVIFAHYGMH